MTLVRLIALLCVCAASSFASSSSSSDVCDGAFPHVTKIVGFPSDWPITDLSKHGVLKGFLSEVVGFECGTKTYQPSATDTFTLEEATPLLSPLFSSLMDELAIPEVERETLFGRVFSQTYFLPQAVIAAQLQTPKPFDKWPTSEEKWFSLLGSDEYLPSALCNGIMYGAHEIETELKRLNPASFYAPVETARKWAYTRAVLFGTKPRKTLEAYEACDKSALGPEIFPILFGGPKTEAEFLERPAGMLNQDIVGECLSAARYIAQRVTPQDRIVCLGNTPVFVGMALKALYKDTPKEEAPAVIFLPLSGAPNGVRQFANTMEDIVTPERHAFYQDVLKRKGLYGAHLLTGTTHIVDVIGNGSGPAYFMGTLLQAFSTPEATPQFHIICMGEMLHKAEEINSRNMQVASKMAKDGESFTLSLPSLDNPYFHVGATVVHVKGHYDLDMMPSSCPALRMLPSYNAARWSALYDPLLRTAPTLTQKILMSYFERNVTRLLKEQAHPKRQRT